MPRRPRESGAVTKTKLLLALAAVAAALGFTATVAAADDLPMQWDPRQVAVNHDSKEALLSLPGQILVGPGGAADVQRVLKEYKPAQPRPYGVTLLTTTPKTKHPVREILDALAKVRSATARRPEGPAEVAPNYVFTGEDAVNFTGEPRIQGG